MYKTMPHGLCGGVLGGVNFVGLSVLLFLCLVGNSIFVLSCSLVKRLKDLGNKLQIKRY